jgi:hypothetical protein
MRLALHSGTVRSLCGSLLALSVLAAQAKVAAACVLEPMRLHHSDASLAQIDTAAPRAPVVYEASAYRRSGLTCGQDICVANNCGDMGGVAIDLDASDDLTPTRSLGYRLELVGGVVPAALHRMLGVELAGPTPLRLQLAFDDVPSVDATLRVIAIDAAGNESAPSEPFALGFDGCTLAATGEQCEHSYDADAEYAASAGTTLVVRAEQTALEAESAAPDLLLQPSASSLEQPSLEQPSSEQPNFDEPSLEQPSFDAENGCSLPSRAPSGSAPNPLAPALLGAALLGSLIVRRR